MHRDILVFVLNSLVQSNSNEGPRHNGASIDNSSNHNISSIMAAKVLQI